MKLGKAIGWGVVIYAVFFLIESIFITYGFVQGWLPSIVSAVILVCLALLAGASIGRSSWKDILPYSITWALIAMIIDGLLSVPFSGTAVYTNPVVWAGYGIIVIAPLFAGGFCLACSALGVSCPLHQDAN